MNNQPTNSHKVRINLKKTEDRSYDILIENGLMERIPLLLKEHGPGRKYAIISDDTVAGIYGDGLAKNMRAAGIETNLLTFPPGDSSKSLSTVEKLLLEMKGCRLDRGDAVIALGGGVSGDIAGFTASVYMRGIPFVQIPTTLLAMADSSVGGKTGVNLSGSGDIVVTGNSSPPQEGKDSAPFSLNRKAEISGGKNLVGTFYQPFAVFIDPLTLKTLPEVEIKNGMSEVLKYGIIYNKDFFEYVEKNYSTILNLSDDHMNYIIKKSVEIKGEIVEQDEKESGKRMILNYGHTLGHALETLSGYNISHGQAIASGMMVVNNMAAAKGILDHETSTRINNLITRMGLLNAAAKKYLKPQNADRLWQLMLSDKKSKSGFVKFVVPVKIGKTVIYSSFTLHHLKGNL